MSIPHLHLLTDTTLQNRFSHLQLAQMARGADAIQYREKQAPDSQEVSAIVEVLTGSNTRLIINDHLQLARLADGLHVGQGDVLPQRARAELGTDKLIGATVHNTHELERLTDAPIDYIGVGPVFGTTSKKTGLPPMGVHVLHEICNLSPYPVIAIGSITLDNLKEVMDAGAYGVAILSAFCLAPDPQAAAHHFITAMQSYS